MASRHTGLCIALFAFLFFVPGYTEPAFASTSEQVVEFQKGVSCIARVVDEGTEAGTGPWRLEIIPPGGPVATLQLPLEGHSIMMEEMRAASFIAPGKQELFISFSQIHNGIYGRAYVVDFSNGAARIIFDSEWLGSVFTASGAFMDQYRLDISFPNLSDRYMLFLGSEKKADYDALYDAASGQLTEARQIAGSYPTRFSVAGPDENNEKGANGLFSLEAAIRVVGALNIDSLGEYVFRLRKQENQWQLHGDTQFIPEPGIQASRFQGAVPVADMHVAVATRDPETALSAHSGGTISLAARYDGWESAPRRQAAALATKNATYTKIIKDYLGRNGLPDAAPQIMQLLKVDLEGDGVDEMVIVAQNIVKNDTAAMTWAMDKPLSSTADIPQSAEKGNYALALVRKIVNGKVREIPLSQFIALKNSGPGDAGWTPPILPKVYQFADLNGDGVMEIIVNENSCEGSSYQVYEINGDKAVKILANGTEWIPAADSAILTSDEARKILQTWLNSHPIDPRPVLANEYKEYTYGDEAHYWFFLDDPQRYWLNFLLHKKTGELLYMMISDGEEATIEIEPLDAWYTKHF